jgi:hypothetical protein
MAQQEPSTRDPRRHWIEQIKFEAGDRHGEVLHSVQGAIASMSDKNPKVRAAALMAGHAVWNLDDDRGFRQKCYYIAAHDDDEAPRSAAIAVISAILEKSQAREAERVLACIVKDSRASTLLRNEAYRALCIVEYGWDADFTVDAVSDAQRLLAGEVIPLVSIDWELVNRLLDAHPAP